MENKQTAVEWLEQEFIALQNYGVNELGLFAKAKAMEREQHGETWDDALAAFDARGFNRVRAIVDFSDYWAEKSKTPPGEHCEEA